MPGTALRADSAQEGSGRTPVAWALDFETWARGSAEYAGVDSELRMRLTTLFFFLNRPTVAALMAVGSAMAAAVKDPNVNPSPDPEPGAAPADKGPPQGTGPAARSGSGSGMPEAADEGGEGAADTSTASPSEAGDAGARPARPFHHRSIFAEPTSMCRQHRWRATMYPIRGVLTTWTPFAATCLRLQRWPVYPVSDGLIGHACKPQNLRLCGRWHPMHRMQQLQCCYNTVSDGAKDTQTPRPTCMSAPGTLVLEGGSERVVFRLLVEVERLEATLNYESPTAPAAALATVEDVRLSLRVHPATLRLAASLGNLRAQDGALPEVGGL